MKEPPPTLGQRTQREYSMAEKRMPFSVGFILKERTSEGRPEAAGNVKGTTGGGSDSDASRGRQGTGWGRQQETVKGTTGWAVERGEWTKSGDEAGKEESEKGRKEGRKKGTNVSSRC